jgi:hypothetical protein
MGSPVAHRNPEAVGETSTGSAALRSRAVSDGLTTDVRRVPPLPERAAEESATFPLDDPPVGMSPLPVDATSVVLW